MLYNAKVIQVLKELKMAAITMLKMQRPKTKYLTFYISKMNEVANTGSVPTEVHP